MAIQIPDPGTGNGASGDNEFVLWSKVKSNFTDTTNAASKLVGADSADKIATVAKIHEAMNSSFAVTSKIQTSETNADNLGIGYHYVGEPVINSPGWGYITTSYTSGNGFVQMFRGTLAVDLRTRIKPNNGVWGSWYKIYTQANTTLDSNGFIKPSSPVLRIYSDRAEGNADGELMAATYTKNGVGDYTISGTTGLRSDGWYIVIPNDMNGNPKVAVTLDDTDGVVTLKTYVRIFDMSTFKFVPDLNQPLDIPDGRWIDLRFEDLPIDDTQMGV